MWIFLKQAMMLSCALCLWKDRFTGQNQHASFEGISDGNGTAGKRNFSQGAHRITFSTEKANKYKRAHCQN